MNNSNVNMELIKQLKLSNNSIPLVKGVSDIKFLNKWLSEKTVIVNKQEISISSKDDLKTKSNVDVINNINIKDCVKCGEIKNKKQGFGSGSNNVMVVLNAPRFIKTFELIHYKKDMLDLMSKMVAAIEINLKDCFITNLIKCELVDPLVKPSIMVNNCLEHLQSEVDLYKPNVVIVMGDILPMQKIVHSSSNVNWYRIEHPITLINNPLLKRGAWNTLLEIKKKLEN